MTDETKGPKGLEGTKGPQGLSSLAKRSQQAAWAILDEAGGQCCSQQIAMQSVVRC